MSGRSTLTLRVESGDRIAKYVSGWQDVDSDTGVWSADPNVALDMVNGFVRFAQRSNVTSSNRTGSYNALDETPSPLVPFWTCKNLMLKLQVCSAPV